MSYVTGAERPGNFSANGRGALVLAVAFVLVALAGSPTASANEFYINACQADRINYSTQAFEDFATRGMLWRRACNPEGPGLRGLITANVVRAGRVERGARSIFILRAPPGTRFSNFIWSGDVARSDCRYALHLWAYRSGGPTTAVKNVRANRNCSGRGRLQIAGWPKPKTYDVSGATSIVQRIVCVGERGKPYCSSRERNFIRTFTAAATVVDTSRPSVSIVPNNPFTRGAWVSGGQSITYTASDNVGIRLARAVAGGLPRGEHPRLCDYAQRVPCSNGSGTIQVDTTRLADGSQSLSVEAVDAAGNSGTSPSIVSRIDNTPPGAVSVSVDAGEGWRNSNAFSLSWDNPLELDRAPISAAHYRLCRVGTGNCVNGKRAEANIQDLGGLAVPGPGEWEARVWREDAAGNQEPANASVAVRLRFDPDPPQLAFEPPPPSDPTLISVRASDRVSGIASGQIEISREGSGTWQVLPTLAGEGRLVSRLDDASLSPGTYVLRATARDKASNQNSTDKRLDGRPMLLRLPLRASSAMSSGVAVKRTVRRVIGRRGKRRTIRRRVTILQPRASVAFDRRVAIKGRLVRSDGSPISGAVVQVFRQSPTPLATPLGAVRTDAKGRYRYITRPDHTQTLRLLYGGTALLLPAQATVTVSVMAASTIHVRPRRVLNGGTVQFSGRLRSFPTPPGGKLVEVQVVLSGRWQTFRTTRTDAEGRWGIAYRFRRTCGVTRYRFRARLPTEAAYPFEAGRTRSVRVQVRGRPCR